MITKFEQKLIDMCNFIKDAAHLHTDKNIKFGMMQALGIVKEYMPSAVKENIYTQEAREELQRREAVE